MVLPFDKWIRMFRIISHNGGITGSVMKLWRTDTLKVGQLMGTDSWGNKYYQSDYYMISRSRWVEFNPRFKWDYEGSQVTAEWYGWLHYKTDNLPSEDPAKTALNCCCWAHCWLQPHEENLTGTPRAFYPFSTVKPYIKPWDGCNICQKPKEECCEC